VRAKASPKVLRIGVALGLVITALGELIKYLLGINELRITSLGLYIIVASPIASLITLGVEYLRLGSVKEALMIFITSLVITASYIMVLIH